MIRNKILQVVKEYEEDNKTVIEWEDREDIIKVFQHLTSKIEIPFEIELRGNGDDWWLQCEYYSKKIQKTIIFDYDYNDRYEDAKDFAYTLLNTQKEIKAFEKKL